MTSLIVVGKEGTRLTSRYEAGNTSTARSVEDRRKLFRGIEIE